MDLIYPIQVNVYSIIILLVLLFNLKTRPDKASMNNRIFGLLIFVNLTLLLFDLFAVVLEGTTGLASHELLHLFNIGMFMIGPLIGIFWLAYIDYYIHRDLLRFKKYWYVLAIPFLLNASLAISSAFHGGYYTITEANVYLRGNMFWIYAVISYGYILYSFVHIIKYHSKFRKEEEFTFIAFTIPPVLAGILQIAFYGTLLTWPMVTFSILIIHLYVQSKMINTDYLTGLYNRREFDYYLIEISKQDLKKDKIAGAILDIDNMKEINDRFGHKAGDFALQEASNILRKVFYYDFVARIGGDEFAVLFGVTFDEEMERRIEKLREEFIAFNSTQKYPFSIEMSIGAEVYSQDKHEQLSVFFEYLDQKMYDEKNKKIAAGKFSRIKVE